jgi:hypothetical protein
MYKNAFEKCFDPLAESDIAAVQNTLKIHFTQELREHYLFCNGGRPKKRCWIEARWEPTCVRSFLPIIPDDKSEDEFGLVNTFQAAVRDVLINGPHIPKEFIPFAEDFGGNYFCQDRTDNAIYFFSMDCGDDFERGKRLLTNTLTNFINNLVEQEN